MTHDEMVTLIKDCVSGGGIWAEFGAGRGNFTRALATLLHSDATIYAIDRDDRALATLRDRWNSPVELRTLKANFTGDLDLPALDGVLMANALHFVLRQARLLRRIHALLKQRGRLIVVEYDRRLPWTPYPVPYTRLDNLAAEAGFSHTQSIGQRTSPRNNVTMYAALSTDQTQC